MANFTLTCQKLVLKLLSDENNLGFSKIAITIAVFTNTESLHHAAREMIWKTTLTLYDVKKGKSILIFLLIFYFQWGAILTTREEVISLSTEHNI